MFDEDVIVHTHTQGRGSDTWKRVPVLGRGGVVGPDEGTPRVTVGRRRDRAAIVIVGTGIDVAEGADMDVPGRGNSDGALALEQVRHPGVDETGGELVGVAAQIADAAHPGDLRPGRPQRGIGGAGGAIAALQHDLRGIAGATHMARAVTGQRCCALHDDARAGNARQQEVRQLDRAAVDMEAAFRGRA
ncbi:hypothetical protein ACFQ4K_26765 [Tistrella bauzanensis]